MPLVRLCIGAAIIFLFFQLPWLFFGERVLARATAIGPVYAELSQGTIIAHLVVNTSYPVIKCVTKSTTQIQIRLPDGGEGFTDQSFKLERINRGLSLRDLTDTCIGIE